MVKWSHKWHGHFETGLEESLNAKERNLNFNVFGTRKNFDQGCEKLGTNEKFFL